MTRKISAKNRASDEDRVGPRPGVNEVDLDEGAEAGKQAEPSIEPSMFAELGREIGLAIRDGFAQLRTELGTGKVPLTPDGQAAVDSYDPKRFVYREPEYKIANQMLDAKYQQLHARWIAGQEHAKQNGIRFQMKESDYHVVVNRRWREMFPNVHVWGDQPSLRIEVNDDLPNDQPLADIPEVTLDGSSANSRRTA